MKPVINDFAISHLPNERLFNFVQIVDNQFGQAAISQLSSVYNNFHMAVQDYQLKLEPVHYVAYTKDISDKDQERDELFTALHVVVLAYTRSPIVAEATAANLLSSVFDKYKGLRDKEYREESGGLFNFIEELETHHQQRLATLHLTEWVNILKNKNQEFALIYGERNVQKREYFSYKEILAARQTVLEAYRELIAHFEASVLVGSIPNGSYQNMVQTINEYIDLEKLTLKMEKGRKKAKKEKENSENGGTTPTPENPTNNNGSDNNGEDGGDNNNTDPNQGEDNTPSANA